MIGTRKSQLVVAVAAVAALASVLAITGGAATSKRVAPAVSIPAFSAADLLAPAGNDWITHNGNLWAWNYSSLKQITAANVGQLQAAWHTSLTAPLIANPANETSASSSQPIEYGGVIYNEDTRDRVYATDATTGHLLWYYDAKLNPFLVGPKGDVLWVNSVRGVTVGDGMVYMVQGEDQVIALDAKTGREVWANQVAPYGLAFYLTAAPLYYDGMLIEGTAGGDSGASCIVFALDAKTGKVLWHYNTIPTQKGMLGFDTWPPLKDRPWIGGGAVWNTPVIDPNLGLIYFGVGNPIPYSGMVRPSGAEGPTESVVALNVKTGKPAWYYQEIHHDIWDWDQSEPPILADFKYQGKLRHGLISGNKDGYVYVLDRQSGKPLFPIPETKVLQSAASHTYPTQPIPQGGAGSLIPHTVDPGPWQGLISPLGKPYVISADTPFGGFDDTEYTVTSTPGLLQWQHNSYDPTTGNAYFQVDYGQSAWASKSIADVEATMAYGHTFSRTILHDSTPGTPAATASHIRLVALNLPTNTIAWVDDYPSSPSTATSEALLGEFTGNVTTAGGVLFAGRSKGYLEAYDSHTGRLLWTSPQLLGGIRGAPSVFTVNGKEAVAIYAGSTTTVAGQTGNASELYLFELP
jgi:quinohemoprotein ethanol dehydrogenase